MASKASACFAKQGVLELQIHPINYQYCQNRIVLLLCNLNIVRAYPSFDLVGVVKHPFYGFTLIPF